MESKRRLEDILSAPVPSFSYPCGEPVHYTSETVALVKEAGYRYACSNYMGTVHWRTPRYQIPRLMVRDWSGDEFERRLSALFDA